MVAHMSHISELANICAVYGVEDPAAIATSVV